MKLAILSLATLLVMGCHPRAADAVYHLEMSGLSFVVPSIDGYEVSFYSRHDGGQTIVFQKTTHERASLWVDCLPNGAEDLGAILSKWSPVEGVWKTHHDSLSAVYLMHSQEWTAFVYAFGFDYGTMEQNPLYMAVRDRLPAWSRETGVKQDFDNNPSASDKDITAQQGDAAEAFGPADP